MQVLKEIMESVVGLGYVMQCVSCVCVTVCMYNANIYNNIRTTYTYMGHMGIWVLICDMYMHICLNIHVYGCVWIYYCFIWPCSCLCLYTRLPTMKQADNSQTYPLTSRRFAYVWIFSLAIKTNGQTYSKLTCFTWWHARVLLETCVVSPDEFRHNNIK
jgi:hypothetical protein